MGYLERTRADRLDLARFLPGGRSVVAVALTGSRRDGASAADDDWRPVSRYARGRDCYDVIRPRLLELGAFIGTATDASVSHRRELR